MRSLWFRILLASFGTIVASLVAFLAIFSATSRPTTERLIRHFQARQIEDALERLHTQGPARAAAYLDRLNRSLGATHYLTDAKGRDLISGEDRSALLDAPRPWLGPPEIGGKVIIVEPSPDGQARLIIVAPPPFNIWAFVPYFILIIAAIGLLCWMLAIGIVSPLHQMATAVDRFGRGDLRIRVPAWRRDEIGDLARAFNQMAERIHTLLTAERRLLQDISHELRSPLARLNIAIELAKRATDRGAAAARLQREADRLTSLVGSLIDVTRMEGDPSAQRSEPVSVREIVSRVAEECALEAQARQCGVVVRNDVTHVIEGHPEMLRRAVENILRNAIRYAPSDSKVEMNAADQPEAITIVVRDYGPGVPEAHLPHLTQPFFRVDEARETASGGIGLGLSIAQRAVHLHQGTLHAENAHPGLRITLRIPVRRESARVAS